MLKLAGEGIIAELIESLAYQPGLPDTGDLEAATKTITATAEATGLANRDYQATLTVPKPSDARLAVLRIAARLAVTIDTMTAATLYCRVYVDAQAANNRLLDLSWTTIGAKLAVVDTHSGNLATIFNLLKDGTAHTFYFFFWVNAGNAVLSLVELWEGVGNSGTTGAEYILVSHVGLMSGSIRVARVGTGSFSQTLYDGQFNQANFLLRAASGEDVLGGINTVALVTRGFSLNIMGTVATDLNYFWGGEFTLRSEP